MKKKLFWTFFIQANLVEVDGRMEVAEGDGIACKTIVEYFSLFRYLLTKLIDPEIGFNVEKASLGRPWAAFLMLLPFFNIF